MRRLIALASLLVLPLALLLFAQWPLRVGVQAYSLLANDVAQILFALYAAVAVTAASRARSHLAIARHTAPGTPMARWRTWALALCVAPWALFLLWTATPQMLASIAAGEIFSEGLTPGYFIVRIALVLLALLVLVDAVGSVLARAKQRDKRSPP